MQTFFKSVLFISFLAAASWGQSLSHAAGLPTVKDFTVEAGEARSRQVPILVLFMEDDCGYCKTALEDFLLPMQRDPEFGGKVILRQMEINSTDALIDFGGKPTTSRKFSGDHKVQGVPNVMLFDSAGNVLTSIEGLLTVDFYYAFLVDAIDQSLAKVRVTEH